MMLTSKSSSLIMSTHAKQSLYFMLPLFEQCSCFVTKHPIASSKYFLKLYVRKPPWFFCIFSLPTFHHTPCCPLLLPTHSISSAISSLPTVSCGFILPVLFFVYLFHCISLIWWAFSCIVTSLPTPSYLEPLSYLVPKGFQFLLGLGCLCP